MSTFSVGSCSEMIKMSNGFSLCFDYLPLESKESQKAIRTGLYIALLITFLFVFGLHYGYNYFPSSPYVSISYEELLFKTLMVMIVVNLTLTMLNVDFNIGPIIAGVMVLFYINKK